MAAQHEESEIEMNAAGPQQQQTSLTEEFPTTPAIRPDPSTSDVENAAEEGAQEDDDDDVTVIVLDNSDSNNLIRSEMMSWIERAGPEMEERRRHVLMRELRRVQRASFIHFALLCVVPTILLLVVIATVLGEEEECVSDVTFCELEPRSFVTAFTTRCICDAIPVNRDG